MIPLPENPTVAILQSAGGVQKIATNISPDIRVEITNDVARFNELAANKPFNVAPTTAQLKAD